MIIAISGRKGSGKTTISNHLIQKGFEKISFATELKRLVAYLYNIDVAWLSDPIKKEEILKEPLIWDEHMAAQMANLIGASTKLNSTHKQFISIREALQYIGTEVLRSYDNDFHVKSLIKYIDSNKNYVLDDVRFKNELKLLKSIGAICIYILRPYYFDNYSNHISEVQLNRRDFDFVLINGRSEKSLLKRFCAFEKYLFGKHRPAKKQYLDRNQMAQLIKRQSPAGIAKKIKCSRDAVIWWCERYLLPIIRNEYSLDHDAFLIPNFESAYYAGLLSADGCVKKSNKYAYVVELASNDFSVISGFRKFLKTNKMPYCRAPSSIDNINRKASYLITINSPFIVDDMKLWNIEPRKSKYNKIPDCIKNNDELFKFWLVGLIDGDGSIHIVKGQGGYRNISLKILASKEIIDYIKNKYSAIRCSVEHVKHIDNLFNLNYSGESAVALYKEIYRGVGLKRKWSKMVPFLNRQWLQNHNQKTLHNCNGRSV